MTDEQFEDFDVPRDIAALLLVELSQAVDRFSHANIPDFNDNADLPKGMLTCGQALRIIPALMAMLRQAHPDLFEEGALALAIREANLSLGVFNTLN